METRQSGLRGNDYIVAEEERAPVLARGHDDAPLVRGGIALGAIVTGTLVAFGAMALLSALAGGLLIALDAVEQDPFDPATISFGLAAGVALVAAQLLAYMWGGYTAGRMARGAGSTNGLLVPVTALLVGGIVAGVVALLGTRAQIWMPFSSTVRFAVDDDLIGTMAVGFAGASAAAMLIGGMLGGTLGARWHARAERRIRI